MAKKKKYSKKKKLSKKKKTKTKEKISYSKEQTCPETPVIWSEDLKFPFCDYCLAGSECRCGAEEKKGSCQLCDGGCYCGYDDGQYGLCECECDCDRGEDDGECDDCHDCGYPNKDDVPDRCYCDCKCPRCTCSCYCGTLIIDADSYNQWVRDACLVCDAECLAESHLDIPEVMLPKEVDASRRCVIEVGDFTFSVITVPEKIRNKYPIPSLRGMRMPAFLLEENEFQTVDDVSRVSIVQNVISSEGKKAACRGTIRFDGPIHTATIAKYDPYARKTKVWMSLTPMEIMSQMPGVEKAHGNVLIGGLGMGWLTRRVLEKDEVDSVTQVELDPDILNFFGLALMELHPEELQLVHADFWEYLHQAGIDQFDTILVDIWPKYNDCRRDELFRTLRKSHPNVWGWGDKRIIND